MKQSFPDPATQEESSSSPLVSVCLLVLSYGLVLGAPLALRVLRAAPAGAPSSTVGALGGGGRARARGHRRHGVRDAQGRARHGPAPVRLGGPSPGRIAGRDVARFGRHRSRGNAGCPSGVLSVPGGQRPRRWPCTTRPRTHGALGHCGGHPALAARVALHLGPSAASPMT